MIQLTYNMPNIPTHLLLATPEYISREKLAQYSIDGIEISAYERTHIHTNALVGLALGAPLETAEQGSQIIRSNLDFLLLAFKVDDRDLTQRVGLEHWTVPIEASGDLFYGVAGTRVYRFDRDLKRLDPNHIVPSRTSQLLINDVFLVSEFEAGETNRRDRLVSACTYTLQGENVAQRVYGHYKTGIGHFDYQTISE